MSLLYYTSTSEPPKRRQPLYEGHIMMSLLYYTNTSEPPKRRQLLYERQNGWSPILYVHY